MKDIKDISIVMLSTRADKRISDIDTSYEIVCAIPRRAPNKAYLEFEHHPARNVAYTFMLDTHKKYRAPKLRNIATFG